MTNNATEGSSVYTTYVKKWQPAIRETPRAGVSRRAILQ
jgi:hypothetical protein